MLPDIVFGMKQNVSNTRYGVALFGLTVPYRLKYYHYTETVESYFELCHKRINELLKEYQDVILIYSDVDDLATCKEFAKRHSESYGRHIRIGEYRCLDDITRLIMNSDYVESPHMHACIIGLVCEKKSN